MKRMALFFLALFLSPAFAQQPDLTEVLLDVPVLPVPVKANNKAQLLYELHITNIGKGGLELVRIDVFADQISKTPLISYDGAHIENWLRRPGLADDLPNKRLIGGGYRAVFFVNVAVELTALPGGLYHRLFFKEENGREVSVESERVMVRHESVVVLNPPLRGDGWVALNSLGAPSHHRLSFLPRGGRAAVPQRYAADWVRLGAEEKLSHDNAGENKNWVCPTCLTARSGQIWWIMEAPIKIRDGLVNLERILPPFLGAKAIVITLQASQHPHA
jgi:hypothetical protein